jgi:hypothetical protein
MKPQILNTPSRGILVCLEGDRAHPTLVRHGRECVKIYERYNDRRALMEALVFNSVVDMDIDSVCTLLGCCLEIFCTWHSLHKECVTNTSVSLSVPPPTFLRRLSHLESVVRCS